MTKTLFVALLLCASTSFANKLCYVGDSQGASEGTVLDRLAPSLSKDHELFKGRSICGASIDSYYRKDQVGCKYKGVTYMQVVGGHPVFERGSGKTEDVSHICSGADTVIVELGDNDIFDPKRATTSARTLAKKITDSGKTCVWIAPASIDPQRCPVNHGKKHAISEAIKAGLQGTGCKFIDSFSLTNAHPPSSGDGMCLHYTAGRIHGKFYAAGYGAWTDAIRGPLLRALDSGIGAPNVRPVMPTSGRR